MASGHLHCATWNFDISLPFKNTFLTNTLYHKQDGGRMRVRERGKMEGSRDFCTHLSLFHCHGLAARCTLFVNAGQEVLGDAEGVLQEGVIWVTGGCVFQKILYKIHTNVKPKSKMYLI